MKGHFKFSTMTDRDHSLYNFDQLINRRTSDSIKWNLYDEDVLPMWVADMDFISPEPVIQALRARVDHGVFGYPRGARYSPKELPELRQTIIDRMHSLYNWQIYPEEILLIPGVVHGFNLACHALVSSQEAVLIQTPVYPPILNAAQTTQIQQQVAELARQEDGSYEVDWDVFEDSITAQTRLFILCNPHNPVGKVFSLQELERMAEICALRDLVICSDEIHSDLIFSGHKHTPIASIDPEIAQRSITLIAPSKTYNIAGLQSSIAIVQNQELREKLLNSTHGLLPGVNLMGLVALKAAYTYGDEWLKQLLVYLENNRNLLVNYVNQNLPGVQTWSPQGTYLAWLDCREAHLDGNPYLFFLQNARVACNDGEAFGKPGKGFIRFNFGCPKSIMQEALTRMRTALISR